MFSSIAATPSASETMRDTSAYSSSVVPQTLTMTVARRSRSSGSFSATKRRAPMPCSPIAFSMPAGVSTMRGAGWPSRSARNSPFDDDRAERRQIDQIRVLDAVAETAARRHQAEVNDPGFLRTSEPMRTERFGRRHQSQRSGGRRAPARPGTSAHGARRPRHRAMARHSCNSRPCHTPSAARPRLRTGSRDASRLPRSPQACLPGRRRRP